MLVETSRLSIKPVVLVTLSVSRKREIMTYIQHEFLCFFLVRFDELCWKQDNLIVVIQRISTWWRYCITTKWQTMTVQPACCCVCRLIMPECSYCFQWTCLWTLTRTAAITVVFFTASSSAFSRLCSPHTDDSFCLSEELMLGGNSVGGKHYLCHVIDTKVKWRGGK